MTDDSGGADLFEGRSDHIVRLTSADVAALREWALISPDERLFIRQLARHRLPLRRSVQTVIIIVAALGGLPWGAAAILNICREVLPQPAGAR